jgi:hypothetical protein
MSTMRPHRCAAESEGDRIGHRNVHGSAVRRRAHDSGPMARNVVASVLLLLVGVCDTATSAAANRSPQSAASVARWRQGGRGRGEMEVAKRKLFPSDEDNVYPQSAA